VLKIQLFSLIFFCWNYDFLKPKVWNIIVCNIINVFTVIFDQYNVFLLNKSINLFQNFTDPKLLNSIAYMNCVFNIHFVKRFGPKMKSMTPLIRALEKTLILKSNSRAKPQICNQTWIIQRRLFSQCDQGSWGATLRE